MKIAILSGKGGTGKTFVSVNLSYIQQDAVYLDCDVEVPNGHLYLPIENPVVEPVDMPIPSILHEKCSRPRLHELLRLSCAELYRKTDPFV